MGIGIVIISLLYIGLLTSEWLFVIFVVGVILVLVCKRWRVPGLQYCIDRFERPEHKKAFPGRGLVFFFLGAWLVVRFFPEDVALAALCILTFGDALAPMISLSNGRRKHPLNNTKLLEGSIAGTIAGFLTAWIFVAWWQALIAAIIAMTVEALEIKVYDWQIDDNLTVPVIAAAIIFVLQLI
jgi:dolichol kinase